MTELNTEIYHPDSTEDNEALLNTLVVLYPVINDVFPQITGFYTRKQCINMIETFLNEYNNNLDVHRLFVARQALVQSQKQYPSLNRKEYFTIINTFLVIYLTARSAVQENQEENNEYISTVMDETIIKGVQPNGKTVYEQLTDGLLEF